MTTLIIGGGLSGLYLAEQLESAGLGYQLLEARDRFGGRILTEQFGDASFDLGPAWFWPGQPRMAALIERLGLQKFGQYASGDLMFEDDNGQVQRARGFASMAGSWRLQGGLAALTDALAARIPAARKRLNAEVIQVSCTDGGCVAKLTDGNTIAGHRVILALPPRIATKIQFSPELPSEALQELQAIPTWMAGQAKVVAVYETPFWREAGLSGDAMSRRGPLIEIHDASPAGGGPFALFGFIGLPAHARTDASALRQATKAQLTRLFGAAAAEPRPLYLKDWALDPRTATEADLAPQHSHPTYGMPRSLQHLWGARLIFAGTEVAASFGGYLEGALEAAECAQSQIISTTRSKRSAAISQGQP